jgi:hypothetical protein
LGLEQRNRIVTQSASAMVLNGIIKWEKQLRDLGVKVISDIFTH